MEKTLTYFEHKEIMAIKVMRVSYGSANSNKKRTTNTARKRTHLFCGLSEPIFDNRRTKAFFDKHEHNGVNRFVEK